MKQTTGSASSRQQRRDSTAPLTISSPRVSTVSRRSFELLAAFLSKSTSITLLFIDRSLNKIDRSLAHPVIIHNCLVSDRDINDLSKWSFPYARMKKYYWFMSKSPPIARLFWGLSKKNNFLSNVNWVCLCLLIIKSVIMKTLSYFAYLRSPIATLIKAVVTDFSISDVLNEMPVKYTVNGTQCSNHNYSDLCDRIGKFICDTIFWLDYSSLPLERTVNKLCKKNSLINLKVEVDSANLER